MRDYKLLQFLIRHKRYHFLCYTVHITIRTLQLKRWLGAVGIFLGRASNILEINSQDRVTYLIEKLHGADKAFHFSGGVIPLQFEVAQFRPCRHLHNSSHIPKSSAS